LVGVAVYIRERKRAEERLQLTLRELDHRVKNVLALVQAVAEHSAATSDSVESFVQDFRARIKAMARMHDALRSKHWQGVDLRDLVELAIAPYRREPDRITGNGPEVVVAADQVQTLGMALHELAANAAKYGAAADRGGCVAIGWTTERTDEGTLLRIVWQEQGGPAVSPPAKRGLGLSLIEDGIRYELAGDSSVRFDPDGVRAEVSILLTEV
jgi:two-component sensor histidine kinase